MESILEALPGQPLSAEDVKALDDAASVRLYPYSWSGTQVVTLVLDEEGQLSGAGFEPPPAATDSAGRSPGRAGETDGEAADAGTDNPDATSAFDTGESGPLGTVEVVEPSMVPEGDPFGNASEDGDAEDQGKPSGESNTGGDSAEDADEDSAEEGGRICVAGYDPNATAWVVVGDVEPGTEFSDIESTVREWLGDTYQERMIDRLAVGPSEYDASTA